MPGARIYRLHGRLQTGTAVGDDQAQVLAFQSTPVQILEQTFPLGLTFALAAPKGQQVAAAVAAHSVGHQHLHPLARPAGRRTRRLTLSRNKYAYPSSSRA